MNGIWPNFTVSSYPVGKVEWNHERIEMEFPYTDKESYREQRQNALKLYEEIKDTPDRVVSLTRLSFLDMDEGDYAPTLLRTSEDPDYEYDGFAERWDV